MGVPTGGRGLCGHPLAPEAGAVADDSRRERTERRGAPRPVDRAAPSVASGSWWRSRGIATRTPYADPELVALRQLARPRLTSPTSPGRGPCPEAAVGAALAIVVGHKASVAGSSWDAHRSSLLANRDGRSRPARTRPRPRPRCGSTDVGSRRRGKRVLVTPAGYGGAGEGKERHG